MDIYVGNITERVREEELKVLFQKFGEVILVKIIRNLDSMTSKGLALVTMKNPIDANNAVKTLNRKLFNGKRIVVSNERLV